MAEPRTLLADAEDIRKMMPGGAEALLERKGDCFYMPIGLFGKQMQGFLCWKQLMRMDGPGSLELPIMLYPDCYNAVRNLFERYVDGIEHCVIGIYFGYIAAFKRRDATVFVAEWPEEAQNVMIALRWPASKPPVFDATSSSSSFMRQFSFMDYWRVWPQDNEDPSFGYDLFCVANKKLGEEFAKQTEYHCWYRNMLRGSKWAEYELGRDYYRQQLKEMVPRLKAFGAELEFRQDFAWLKRQGERAAYCWYCQESVDAVKLSMDARSPLLVPSSSPSSIWVPKASQLGSSRIML